MIEVIDINCYIPSECFFLFKNFLGEFQDDNHDSGSERLAFKFLG